MQAMFVQCIVLILAMWSKMSAASDSFHPIVKRQIYNPCLYNNPCQNGATCIFALVNRVNYVTSCTCAAGYAGSTCSVATGTSGSSSVLCATLGCLNGGTCIQIGSNAYCQCPSGYSGVRCQVQSGVSTTCVGLTCYNGGACTTNGVVAYCICPTGTFGQYCQFGTPTSVVTVTASTATGTSSSSSTLTTSSLLFNCLNNTICQNGGTCYYSPNPPYSISCRCPATYSGAFCQSRSTFCSTSPCLNGGTCVQNSYDLNGQCSCPSGYSGLYCEARNCTTYNPCQNNQQCLNVYGLPYCFCTSVYTGIYCETAVSGKRR